MTTATAIRYEIVAAPFYTIEGVQYPETLAKIGDTLKVRADDNEPDEDGDLFGTLEDGTALDLSTTVLKRLA